MMHYLSVHDLVWINTTLTGKTVPYSFEKLEAAMAAQYSYGDSRDTVTQAASFLGSFLTKPPFQYGNLRTAFIATATFLTANGFALQVSEEQAVDIIQRAARKETTPAQAISLLAKPSSAALRPGVSLRQLVTHLINEHAEALKRLASIDE